MGIGLIVEVMDHAPAELTPVDRLLLLVIAEQARDTTREGFPGWELLARRMRWDGQKDGGKNAVSTALAALARRGVDVRVPIGVSATGAPVYAAKGHRTTYRVPKLPPPPGCECFTCQRVVDTATHEGWQGHPPNGAQRVAVSASKGGNPGGQRVAVIATPSPQVPSETPHLPRDRVGKLIAAAGAASDEEIEKITERIKSEHQPRNLGAYVDALSKSGDLAELVQSVRADLTRADTAAAIAEARKGPPCVHGEAGGAFMHPTGGEPLCPFCRRAARLKAS